MRAAHSQNGGRPPAPLGWQEKFLDHYRETLNMAAATQAAGITRPTIYKYLREVSEFKQRFEWAKEDAIDTLEGSAYRRATHAVKQVPQAGQFASRSSILKK